MASESCDKTAEPGAPPAKSPDFREDPAFSETTSEARSSGSETTPDKNGLRDTASPAGQFPSPPETAHGLPRWNEAWEHRLLLGMLGVLAVALALTTLLSVPAMRIESVSSPPFSLADLPRSSSSGETTPSPASREVLNLNTADAQQLQTLPGIGATMAERILAYREQHGAFTDPAQLLSVRGIGQSTFRALADFVTVDAAEVCTEACTYPVDLNTAEASVIAQLPGIGDSLAAELTAYRAEHGTFHWFEQLLQVRGFGEGLLEQLEGKITLGAYASPHEYRQFPINLNTASAETLELLPGIGESIAAGIVDYREQHGPFTSVQQLTNVSGIGETKLRALMEYVSLETAAPISREERFPDEKSAE